MEENKEIKEAKEKLEELSSDEELRRIAFLEEKGRRDRADQMKDARKKGMEKGLEQGRKEERQNMIRKLYEMGLEIQMIATAVEMKPEEVEKWIHKLT